MGSALESVVQLGEDSGTGALGTAGRRKFGGGGYASQSWSRSLESEAIFGGRRLPCPTFPSESGGPGLEKELSPRRLSPRAFRPGEAAVPQRKIFL